jgi:tetratricopeptide (TPR) repeat protein
MKHIVSRLKTPFCFILLSLAAAVLAGQHLALAGQNDIPAPARAVLAKATSLVHQKDYDKAIEILSAFMARAGVPAAPDQPDPKGYHHAQIYFALGTCYLLKTSYQQAAQALEQAVRKDPGHSSAWLNLARAAYELGNYPRAAQCFASAYDSAQDKNPEYLYDSAASYLVARQNEASIAAFQRLFKAHPDKIQPAWRENFVQALLAAGRALEALPHIRQLAEQFSGEKQIQWQEILLHQYLQLNMDEQAQAYALFLTRQSPTRAKWWKALAQVYLQQAKYPPALTALTVYSYLAPLSDQESKLLADLNLQLGIPIKAARLYEEALQAKSDAHLVYHLMVALQQLGQPQQALEALSRFAPDSKDPQLLMLKADLLYGLEQYQAAAQAYRQSAQTTSEQKGRAWLMAGYAALQADDTAASRQAFEKAAAFEGHRQAALTALKQLPKTQLKVSGKRSRT